MKPSRFEESARPREELPQEDVKTFDENLRRISTALFAAGMVVILLVANAGVVEPERVEQAALNWVVVVAGISIAGILLFPWRRYNRNLFVIVSLSGMCIIAIAIYFSGGWESPFFPFYFFVVVFVTLYYAPQIALLLVFLTFLVSTSPQLYEPDTSRLVAHAVVAGPSYLALALVSWYMMREIGRREHLKGETERRLGEMRQLRDHYQQAAHTDHLTNLPNRSYFETRLREEIKRARRQEQEFALIFLDIDDFKLINDSRGHQAGDEALKLVAEVLCLNAREIDLVARHGGEEFTALLVGASLEGTQDFFERVREEVTYHGDRKQNLTLRLSGGAAIFPRDAEDPDGLLEAADRAMYEAKYQGKDRLYHPSLNAG